jgi:hypothetical protein
LIFFASILNTYIEELKQYKLQCPTGLILDSSGYCGTPVVNQSMVKDEDGRTNYVPVLEDDTTSLECISTCIMLKKNTFDYETYYIVK